MKIEELKKLIGELDDDVEVLAFHDGALVDDLLFFAGETDEGDAIAFVASSSALVETAMEEDGYAKARMAEDESCGLVGCELCHDS